MSGTDDGGRPEGALLAEEGSLGTVTISGGGFVALRHDPSVQDYLAALKVRLKAVPRVRNQRLWLYAYGLGLGILPSGILTSGHSADPVGLAIALSWILFVTAVMPRIQARSFRNVAAARGESRIVVDGSGVRVKWAHESSGVSWPAIYRYAETKQFFVLLSRDKYATSPILLPRWDEHGRDVSETLRDLLDGHGVPRWGPARG